MNRRVGLILFCILLSCVGNQLFASDWFGSRSRIELPLTTICNMNVIQVQINHSKPLNLILDTGIKYTLLTEVNTEDSVDLTIVRTTRVRGWGDLGELNVSMAIGNEFRIGSFTTTNHNVYILDEQVVNFSALLGIQINGITGADVFSNYVVEYRYDQGKLILHKPEKFKLIRSRRNEILPMEIINSKPYISVDLTHRTGIVKKSNVLIDTGMTDALWLFSSNSDSTSKDKKHEGYLGKGLSGDIFGTRGRIAVVGLGRYNLNSVTVSYPDSVALTTIPDSEVSGRDGTLGNEVLSRFNLIIDYPHNRLIFRPNSRFKKPFYQDYSGLIFKAPFNEVPYYEVSYVEPSSPAQRAGILPGDQLMYIEGDNTASMNLNDIYYYFQSREGSLIRLVLRRGSYLYKAKLVLKEFE